MAAGVMATTAPWASTSVLERITVMRPLPSSQRCTSPQVRAEASERRNPTVGQHGHQGHVKLPPLMRPARAFRCRGRGGGAGRR